MAVASLVGKQFNYLTVISRGENTSSGNATWNCKCKCGNSVNNVVGTLLKNETKISCGCVTKSKIEYYNKVKKMFEDNNCVCLETEWKSARERWKYKCSCGNISDTLPQTFKESGCCTKCSRDKVSENKSTTKEEIENYFSKSNNKLLNIYKGSRGRTYVEYLCENNHKNNKPFWQAKKHICKKCSKKERSDNFRLKESDISKELFNLGLEYIEGYTNIDKPFIYKCSCGNVANGYLSALRKGIRCGCGYKQGEENPKWNHNLSKEERDLKRAYPEYREWVESVFVRDNYTCQICWSVGHKLNAHHLEPYSVYKDKRLDLNNGITLCQYCHKEFHSIYGINTCNTSDFYDFIDFTEDKRTW